MSRVRYLPTGLYLHDEIPCDNADRRCFVDPTSDKKVYFVARHLKFQATMFGVEILIPDWMRPARWRTYDLSQVDYLKWRRK